MIFFIKTWINFTYLVHDLRKLILTPVLSSFTLKKFWGYKWICNPDNAKDFVCKVIWKTIICDVFIDFLSQNLNESDVIKLSIIFTCIIYC